MNVKQLSLILLSTFLFTYCSSRERKIENVPVNASIADNPAEAITALEREISEARENEVHLLSPTWFSSAEKSLADAKNIQRDGGDLHELYRQTAEGKIQIQRAKDFAEASRKHLADVKQEREAAYAQFHTAKKSGATNLSTIGKQLESADKEFATLAKAIEDNDIQKAHNGKDSAIKAYRSVELRGLKTEKLDMTKRVIEQAKKEGADKLVPRTLDSANQNVTALEKFISNNPQDTAAIERKSNGALAYANRTLYLTRLAKEMGKRDSEENVFWMESKLNTISTALGHEILPADTFEAKVQSSVAGIQQIKTGSRTDQKVGQPDRTLRNRMAAVVEENRDLRAENEMQAEIKRKLVTIEKDFTPQEAEVFFRNNQVVIRAKGIQFPTGDHRLQTQHFALLQKVAKAVEMFPGSTVVVEGHTDSVGSSQANQQLSQKRAEVVREFLVSRETVEPTRISAVGMSFSRPITSNKTKEGRATNRRIDVVISGFSQALAE